MEFIIDNGLEYSNHEIIFVDAGEMGVELVAAVLEALPGECEIIGQAERIEWRHQEHTMPFLDWVARQVIADWQELRAVMLVLSKADAASVLGRAEDLNRTFLNNAISEGQRQRLWQRLGELGELRRAFEAEG